MRHRSDCTVGGAIEITVVFVFVFMWTVNDEAQKTGVRQTVMETTGPDGLKMVSQCTAIHVNLNFLSWKLVVDFLFVLIELLFARCYGWEATSEYWLEIGVFEGVSNFRLNFHVEENVPHKPFLHEYWTNALQLRRWRFSHEETL